MANVTTTINTVSTSIDTSTNVVSVSTNNNQITTSTGQSGPQGPAGPKTLTVLEPFAGDSFTIFYSVIARTISSINVGIYGTGSPSVTFTIKQATDRSSSGTTVVSSTTVSNPNAATQVTILDPNLLASSFIWLEITNVSGVVNEFHLTMEY